MVAFYILKKSFITIYFIFHHFIYFPSFYSKKMNQLNQVTSRHIRCYEGMRRINSIHERCSDCQGYLGKLKKDFEYRCVQKSCVERSRGKAYAAIVEKLLKEGLIPVDMCSGIIFLCDLIGIVLTFFNFKILSLLKTF